MEITRKGAVGKNPEAAEKGICSGSQHFSLQKKRSALVEGIMVLSAALAISSCDGGGSGKKTTRDAGCEKDNTCLKDGSSSPDGVIVTDGGNTPDGGALNDASSESVVVKPGDGGASDDTKQGIDGITTLPDGRTANDDGNATTNDGGGQNNDGSTTTRDTSPPGDAIVLQDGDITVGDAKPGGDGIITTSDGNATTNDGGGQNNDGSTTTRDTSPSADATIPDDSGPQFLKDLAGRDFGPSACTAASTGTFTDTIWRNTPIAVGGYVFTYTGPGPDKNASGAPTSALISITCGGVPVGEQTGSYPVGGTASITITEDMKIVTVKVLSAGMFTMNVQITVAELPP